MLLLKLDKPPKYSFVVVRRFGVKIGPTPIPKIGPKSDLEHGGGRRRCSPTYSEYILRKQLGMVIFYDGFWCAIFPTGNRTKPCEKPPRRACDFVVLNFTKTQFFAFFEFLAGPATKYDKNIKNSLY